MEAACKIAKEEGEQWTSVSSSSSSSSGITDLPIHILKEVLLRLPIKTLVVTKCVCKSWLHLINDPKFSKLHQTRAKVEVCFEHHYQCTFSYLYLGSFHARNDSHSLDMELNTLFHRPKLGVDSYNYEVICGKPFFVNSCNGLLCYSSGEGGTALIWNPITREFITFFAPDDMYPYFCFHGLGFSQKTNRFKLLRLVVQEEYGSDKVIVASIFTIEKGSSWRSIGLLPYSLWIPSNCYRYNFRFVGLTAFFLQGTLHWVVAKPNGSDRPVIACFDFETEKFGTMPLPRHFESNCSSDLISERVGVLGGCIFVVDHTERSTNVWVMKEYGIQDSWTRAFSLEFTTLHEWENYTCCVPICYLDNGHILMKRTKLNGDIFTDLLLYNPLQKSIKVIGSSPGILGLIAYSPTLVMLRDSVMGYDEVCQTKVSTIQKTGYNS